MAAKTRLEDWTMLDHLEFLFRSAQVIIAPALICAVVAFLLAPKTKATAEGMLRIGVFHGFGAVEPAADVAARISGGAFLGSLLHAYPKELPYDEKQVTLAGSLSSGLVELTATAPTESAAVFLVEKASERIITGHGLTTQHVRQSSKERLQEIDEMIGRLRAELSPAAQAAPEATGATPSAALAAALAQAPLSATDRQGLLDHLARMQTERAAQQFRIDPAVSPATELLEAPQVRLTHPALKVALAALVLGLGFGVFLAHFLEQLRRARSSETAVETDYRADRPVLGA